jgi:5,6,7,8-tetrahydromethanopterin hydro-lyase
MVRHTTVELGESFIDPGVNAARINTILSPRGSAAETAWTTSLATPSAGHEPFVVITGPGVPVQPFTVFVSKTVPANDRHEQLIWGAAQAGVAAGVADALANSTIATATTLANAHARRPTVDTALATRGQSTNPFFTPTDGGEPGTESTSTGQGHG